MKTLISFVILLCLSLSVFSQNKLGKILPLKNGVVTYNSTVNVNGANKALLYARAKKWITEAYTGENVLKTDKSQNKLMGTGKFSLEYKSRTPDVFYTVAITIKREKYKYILTRFAYIDKKKNRYAVEDMPSDWSHKRKLYTKIDEEASAVIGSLQKAMDPSTK